MDGTASSGGDAAGDLLSGIEQVIGTGFGDTFLGTAADETFNGGGGDDTLTGAGGNDSLYGEAGNDVLNGGAGSDVLDGGAGTDTVTYANSALGVTANLADSSFNTNEAAGDTYNQVENLTGSAFNDRLTGDGADNVLDGGAGNDRLAGGAGADSLIGGAATIPPIIRKPPALSHSALAARVRELARAVAARHRETRSLALKA